MLLFLFVAAVGSSVLAAWEWHEAKQARKADQEAAEKSEKAAKETEKAKGKLRRAVNAEKARIEERDRAQEEEKSARHAEEELKSILAFFKNKLLSVGRPGDVSLAEAFWAGSANVTARKGITLRQAVDETEAHVAATFADRPMAEASVREMLGLAYLNLGAAKEAVEQYEHALALRKAELGVSRRETADCRNQLAVAYRLAGRDADASRLYHHNPNSSAHAAALAARGSMLLLQKKPAEAERKLRECFVIRRKIQPDKWTTFETKSLLGGSLLDQKKYADAEPLLLSGYEGLNKAESQIPSDDKGCIAAALDRLVRLYDAWGKKEKARKWRGELEHKKAAEKH